MKKWSRKSRSYCRDRVQEKSPVEKLLDDRRKLMEDFVLEMARQAPDGIEFNKKGRISYLRFVNRYGVGSLVSGDGLLYKVLRGSECQMILAWLQASKTILMTVRENGFFCCLSEDGFNWAIEIEEDRKQEWMEAQWEQEQNKIYAPSVSADVELSPETIEVNQESSTEQVAETGEDELLVDEEGVRFWDDFNQLFPDTLKESEEEDPA